MQMAARSSTGKETSSSIVLTARSNRRLAMFLKKPWRKPSPRTIQLGLSDSSITCRYSRSKNVDSSRTSMPFILHSRSSCTGNPPPRRSLTPTTILSTACRSARDSSESPGALGSTSGEGTKCLPGCVAT
jgi:hypothetical protein